MHMISGLRKSAVALAAGASLFLAASQAQAVPVFSGPVNIAIPSNNLDGIYLNVLTGVSGTSGMPGGVAGWDINPFGTTNLRFFSATPLLSSGYAGVGTAISNLALGASVGATSTFINATAAPAASIWNLNSSNNFVGFRFLNEGADLVSPADDTVHYGYFQIALGTNTFTGRSIVGYAFESVPGASITVVPEPGTYALMGLGLAGLLLATRRRKQA